MPDSKNPIGAASFPSAESTEVLSDAGPTAKVGKYQILNELGRGACGTVYKAIDPFVQREVAIKIARRPASAGEAVQPGMVQEFFAEARAAGRLQHPNIVSVFDAGSEQGLNYIVMEYVEGMTVGQRLRENLPPEDVVGIAFDCAKALDYAHRANVLHRDVKPDNIMLRQDGMTKLMDFSIAALMQDQLALPDVILGTPAYMAPEQIAGEPIGPATDLYSLGAVMYKMLTGSPPHQAQDRGQLLQLIRTQRAHPLAITRPDLPEKLSAIVDRLLSLAPQQRFASGHELGQALLQVYDRRTVTLRRTPHSAERQALAAMDFCRDMTSGQIDELLAAGRIRRVRAGETILSRAQEDTDFYLIVLGQVRIENGFAMTLAQNEVFGTLALPGASSLGMSAVAQSDGLLLQVTREALEHCTPGCQVRVYQACCSELKYHLSIVGALSGH